jgi:hypothetical protein
VKPSELEDLLSVLDKHPRVTCVRLGEVVINLGEAMQAAPEGTGDDDGESLELPPGVVDPRARIREVYRKANLKRDGKVPS